MLENDSPTLQQTNGSFNLDHYLLQRMYHHYSWHIVKQPYAVRFKLNIMIHCTSWKGARHNIYTTAWHSHTYTDIQAENIPFSGSYITLSGLNCWGGTYIHTQLCRLNWISLNNNRTADMWNLCILAVSSTPYHTILSQYSTTSSYAQSPRWIWWQQRWSDVTILTELIGVTRPHLHQVRCTSVMCWVFFKERMLFWLYSTMWEQHI